MSDIKKLSPFISEHCFVKKVSNPSFFSEISNKFVLRKSYGIHGIFLLRNLLRPDQYLRISFFFTKFVDKSAQ